MIHLCTWDAARMSKDIPEQWDNRSVHNLWEQDDVCVPDGETAYQAWQRLFGLHPVDEEVLARAAHGNAVASLYSRGRILWVTCEGSRIEQLMYMPAASEVEL